METPDDQKLTKEKPLNAKSWDEFRKTGLFLIVNQILHAFGWTLAIEMGETDNSIVRVFPARTLFRGFPDSAQDEDYKKVTEYLAENAEQLLKDVNI